MAAGLSPKIMGEKIEEAETVKKNQFPLQNDVKTTTNFLCCGMGRVSWFLRLCVCVCYPMDCSNIFTAETRAVCVCVCDE